MLKYFFGAMYTAVTSNDVLPIAFVLVLLLHAPSHVIHVHAALFLAAPFLVAPFLVVHALFVLFHAVHVHAALSVLSPSLFEFLFLFLLP